MGAGDEIGDEELVFVSLRDGLRIGHQPARLHARQPAEPGQLDLVVAEGRNRRVV